MQPEPKRPRRALGIMALEPRIMFDGAAVATAAAVVDVRQAPTDAVSPDAAPATRDGGASAQPAGVPPSASELSPSGQPKHSDPLPSDPEIGALPAMPGRVGDNAAPREIVFIDSNVPDIQTLVDGIKPGLSVYVLGASRDGVGEIAEFLQANQFQQLDAIHIVGHGHSAAIDLGSATLSSDTLTGYSDALAQIGAALGADGDLLLYGCETAQGALGLQFIADLSARTGADVAASTDATGTAVKGGDWTLEAATGAIESAMPFSAAATDTYRHVLANETLTVTQVTVLGAGDADGDGVIDPGETVTTTVTITNNSTNTDALDVTLQETLNGMTLVPGSVRVTPIAFDDIGGTIRGNTPVTVTAAQMIDNDVDFDGDEAQLVITNISSLVGGTATLVGGNVVFTPTTGFIGTASFDYTIRDQQNLESVTTGKVTFTVTDPVWYVDGQNGNDVTGDGSYANPFATLSPLNAVGDLDDANDTIFVYNRGGYTSGIALETGQWLLGDGDDAFAVNATNINGVVGAGIAVGQEAGTGVNTTLGVNAGIAVTLGTNNTVRGLTIANTGTGATAIADGGGTVGNLTISNTIISGSGKAVDIDQGGTLNVAFTSLTSTNSTSEGVDLQGVGGSFSAAAGAISGSTGTAFNVVGGNAGITYGGTIDHSAAARMIVVQDTTGGSVAFNTATANGLASSGSSTGILIDGAAGAVTVNNASLTGAVGIEVLGDAANAASGTFTFNNVSIDTVDGNASNHAFIVNGDVGGNVNRVTGTIDLNNVDITNPGGNVANIQGLGATGVVDFDGASNINRTDNGLGVLIVSNLAGSSITFGGPTQTLTTGANAAIDIGGPGTVNFTPAAGGSGLDITTTTGRAFNAFGAVTLTVTGAGNSINASLGEALILANVTVGAGGVNFAQTNSGTGGSNVNLVNNVRLATINGTGAISLGTGTLNNASGVAFQVTAGTGTNTIDYDGSILKASDGLAIEVQNRSGGTVSFDGAVTSNGASDGILLNSNTGATITFTNTLTLNTSASNSTAFTATNGGTVTATGAGSVINAGQATAVNVRDTTIGAAHLTFQSVSSNGGSAAGIVLVNTGTSGGLRVTGTDGGDGDTFADAGTGGTIANKSGGNAWSFNVGIPTLTGTTDGVGVYMSNTRFTTLNGLQLNDFSNAAIAGFGSSDFTLNDSVASGVSGNDVAQNESALFFYNMTGTNAINRGTYAGGFEDNLHVLKTNGTASSFTVTGATFGLNNTVNGNNNITVEALNAGATVTFSIFGSTIRGARADWLNAQASAGATLNLNIGGPAAGQGNSFDNTGANAHPNAAANGNRILLQGGGTANINIINNVLKGSLGSAIATNSQGPQALHQLNIIGNDIGVAGTANSGSTSASGISIQSTQGGDVTALIQNNDVVQYNNHGILLTFGDVGAGNPQPTLNVTVDNNRVNTPGTLLNNFNGFHLNAGQVSATDAFTLTLDIKNNNFTGSGKGAVSPNNNDIRLQQRASTTIVLPGYAGPARDDSDGIVDQVVPYLTGKGNVFGSATANSSVNLAGGYVNGAAPPLPPAPLLALPGGEPDAGPTHSDPLPVGPQEPGSAGQEDTPTAAAPDTTPPAAAGSGGQSTASGGNDTTPSSGDTQQTATPPASPIVDDGVLTQAELDFLVEAAIQRWADAGLSDEQIAALRSVEYTIADMSNWQLASATTYQVNIDADAAGFGWFLDETPFSDAEFVAAAGVATRMTAGNGSKAASKYDLLTTIMHEQGHVLGIEDSYAPSDRNNLMYGYLVTGERRLATDGQAIGAQAASYEHIEYVNGTLNIGTLPFGKSVSIIWDATVNTQTNQVIVNPVNQGTVSASNTGDVGGDNGGTDFQDVNTNTVTTVLDSLTIGNRVFDDKNADGQFNGADVGVNGVTLSLYVDDNEDGNPDGAAIATTTTAGGGFYAFAGLAPGKYVVRVDAANFNVGNVLAAFTDSSPGAPDPDTNIDNDDNGGPRDANGITSGTITLAYDAEPDGTPDVDGDADADTNLTLDFGVITNIPPSATNLTQTKTYTEGDSGVALDDIVVTEPDAGDTITATLILNTPAAGVLTTSGAATYDAGTGVWTITGTVADVNEALAAVAFVPATNNDVDTTITTRIRDQHNAGPADGMITLDVTPVADAPTATNLTQIETYAEGAANVALDDIVVTDVDTDPVQTITATLTLNDPATGVLTTSGTATYDTVTGVWTITGTVTDVNAALAAVAFVPGANNDVDTTITVAIRDQDGTGPDGEITLDVTPINDVPIATNTTQTKAYTEGAASVALDDIVVTDADSGEIITATLTLAGPAAGTLTTSGAATYDVVTGVWTISGSVADVNAALAAVAFVPAVDNDVDTTITVTIRDQAGTGPNGVITLDVTPVNDPPTATNLTQTRTYAEGAAGVALDDVVVSEVDTDPAQTITATLTLNNPATGVLTTSGAATYDAVTGVWTITGTAADVNAALVAVAFVPTINNDVDTSITVTIRDQDNTGPDGVITLDVTPVNDAPTATNLTQTKAYTEGAASVVLDDIVVSDVDTVPAQVITATLTLDNPATGVLTTSGAATYDAVTGVWTITGSVADVNAALAAVAFVPATNNDADATITVTIRDQAGAGPNGLITLDVTPVNDAPTATNLTQARTYAEDSGNVALDDIVVSDVDTSPAQSITATLTLNNPTTGTLTTSGGATYNAATGVWTITGSVANVNAALAAVTFVPAANNDVDTTITVVIRDQNGTGPANGTITLDVSPVNDAPVLSGLDLVFYNANRGGSVAVHPDLVITDVDSTTLTGAKVQIELGLSNRDRLNFTAQNGITGSYNAATGVLTLTGTATVAQYQAALRSVTFSSEVQQSGLRLITWEVNDGAAVNNRNAFHASAIVVAGRIVHHDNDHDGHHGGGHHGHSYSDLGPFARQLTIGDRPFNFTPGAIVYFVRGDVQTTVSENGNMEIKIPLASLEAPLGGDIASVTAQLADGTPLPGWLKFDPATGTFKGQVPDDVATGSVPGGNGNGDGQPTTMALKVVVRDSKGQQSIMTFTVTLPGSTTLAPGGGNRSFLLPLPGDRASLTAETLHAFSAELERAVTAAVDAQHVGAAGDAAAGRAGLTSQLGKAGWRAMDAQRQALLDSLQSSGGTLH